MPQDNYPTEFHMRPGSRKRYAATALVFIALCAWPAYEMFAGHLSSADQRHAFRWVTTTAVPAVACLMMFFGAPLHVSLDEAGFTYVSSFSTVRVRWEEVLSAGFPVRKHQPVTATYDVRFRRGMLDMSGRTKIGLGSLEPGPRAFDAAFTHYWKNAKWPQWNGAMK